MKKHLLYPVIMMFCMPFLCMHAQDTLTVLHLNDTHSNLSSGGSRGSDLKGTLGGLARAATIIEQEKTKDPGTILLHAGDSFIGDLSFSASTGLSELQWMQDLGFDAMTLGNHEFDLTPLGLQMILDASGITFPLLSANLVLLDPLVEGLNNYVQPFTVKTVKGVNVGIFGMTTPETNILSSVGTEAFIDTLIGQRALAVIDTLRNNRGCSVVIMLSHLGIALDRKVAAMIPGIDAIIGGHDHILTTQSNMMIPTPTGGSIPVVQADAFYHDIGKLRFVVKSGKASFLDWTDFHLDSTVPEHPLVSALIDTMNVQIEAFFGAPFMTQKIATVTSFCEELATDLDKVGNHDTPMGNLVTDAFRAAMKTDIAITAGGSIAQPLYAGPIVANDVMRAVGYGFNDVNSLGYRMVTFDLPGLSIYAALQYFLTTIDQSGDEFFVQVSGMKYDYIKSVMQNGSVPPRWKVSAIEIGGQPIDVQASYSIAANEFALYFLETLLPLMSMPAPQNVLMPDSSLTEFQVFSAFLTAKQNISQAVEGRIRNLGTVIGVDDPPTAHAPLTMELGHYPNPATSKIAMNYTIPSDGFVHIGIYDMSGREVISVVNQHTRAGIHFVNVNTSALSPGMYTYSLQSGDKSVSRKMMIINNEQ